jgi:hypothetical protein
MARNVTYSLDEATLDLVEWLAKGTGTSRTAVVREAITATAALFAAANHNAFEDIHELRRRYGDDARLVAGVFNTADGKGIEGRVLINNAVPDDVRAYPVLPFPEADHIHVYLDVKRESPAPELLVGVYEQAILARVGSEAVLARGRLPIGELPWPLREDLAIVVRVGDLKPEMPADAPEASDAALEQLRVSA